MTAPGAVVSKSDLCLSSEMGECRNLCVQCSWVMEKVIAKVEVSKTLEQSVFPELAKLPARENTRPKCHIPPELVYCIENTGY